MNKVLTMVLGTTMALQGGFSVFATESVADWEESEQLVVSVVQTLSSSSDEEEDTDNSPKQVQDYSNSKQSPIISQHGTVTILSDSATLGDTIIIDVQPDSGYKVEEIIVKRIANAVKQEVTQEEDGTFTFRQPYGRVSIEVVYSK